MIKKSIRFLSVILLFTVAASALLVSCGDRRNEGDVTTASSGETSATAAETTTPLAVALADYDDYEFNIQTYVRSEHDFDYFGGIGAESGDTMDDAVYKRNVKTEDHLGIKLKSTPITSGYKSMATNLMNAAMSGTYSFDMISTSVASMTPVALSGGLYDINSLDSVELSNPWWDEALNTQFSIGFKQYYISGDALTINYDGTYIIRFNQDLAADHELTADYFYSLVTNREWTIDKMLEISAGFVSTNGDDVLNYDDNFGIVAVNTFTQALWYGSGLRLVNKDGDDLPVFVSYSESTQKAYEKIVSVFASSSTYNTQPSANRMSGKNHAQTADTMLLTGKALFQSTVLESMIRTNDSDTKVGILPIPMSSADQSSYGCIVNPSGFCSAIALPVLMDNPQRTSDVLETMMYYSAEYIRPAYFDTVIQYKVLDDQKSYDILGIILAGRVAPDLGVIYGWGNLMSSIQTNAAACSPSVQTVYTTVTNVIERELTKLREDLNK